MTTADKVSQGDGMTTEQRETAAGPPMDPDAARRELDRIGDPFTMRLCAWSGVVMILAAAAGVAGFAHMVPARPPLLTTAQIQQWVLSHQVSILVGASILFIFWCLWMTFNAPLIVYVRRTERGAPVLTYALLALSGAQGALVLLIALDWAVLAYRVEDGTLVQFLYDTGWFLFTYTWPPFTLFMCLFAFAMLRDERPEPLFPRWVPYYTIFGGLGMVPGTMMAFFKDGPFAYNGLFGYWFPIVDFWIWMCVFCTVLFKAIKRDEKRIDVLSAHLMAKPT